MTGARVIRSTDAERAISDMAREHEALANMTGADSRRIDKLVGDVGALGGDVRAVKEKVEGVADGVNELRDALTVLVRHDVQMQNHAAQSDAMKRDVISLGDRVQTLEKQVGPLVETRKGLIVLAGAVATTILLALVGLVLKT